jgi:diguanylate cyclase (GGDEF)-like protein/PAS domain S-box-containing protein
MTWTPESGQSQDGQGFNFAVSLMQYLVVPTFVLDEQGQVIIWNKACERLTGLPAAEVLGTREHWRAFYKEPRPCLADLVAQQRLAEVEALYVTHDDPAGRSFGVRAENWCVMPRLGRELYLAIDVGPIYNDGGQLVAVVETLRDMTDERLAKTELERLATRDGLTGLINRRHFDQTLHTEWARMRRDGRPLSLLMIDVDHFKRYNDVYGHLAGDGCLKQVAHVLNGALLRPSDEAARYGGEEFAIILPDTDHQGVETVAQRVQDGMKALAIPHSEGEGGVVTLSMGMASVTPDGDTRPEQLLLMADEALYRAKHAGRNRFVLHSMPATPPL